MLSSPQDILKKYWGYHSFRGSQEAIINAIADGEDVLALLPTGGGKSVCFQVPALMKEGLCLVISPLISLMKDQVENLEKKGITAIALHGGLSFYEVATILQQAAQGDYKFLYLSPERLETKIFKEYLHVLNITLIAVDEAHCISQWGYDFRPSYLRIASLREELPAVPVIALTASATKKVQDDIVAKLHFKNPNIFRGSFKKSNLSYSVFKVESKINKVVDILNHVAGSSIVYCRNRKQTKNVAQLLSLQNISADHYHAGLTQEERGAKQNNWISNNTRVMVCTNAFGMGIDKPDVRTVIHYDVPDCLENYYQEAGRAGRDEKKSFAVLLYQSQDETGLQCFPDIRFPLIPDIRKVYQSLADFLQIPVGIGEGNYYDFDLNEFIKNFKLDAYLVINVLKVLEQEGHLSFNENIFLPSQVTVIASKELLIDFERNHPGLEPVLKCLLRTYQGIIDNRVSIHEKQVAKLARLPYEKVYADLKELQAFRIIEYLPQKETPQIFFQLNRAPASSLHINHDAYLERKRQYQSRIDTMLAYLHLQDDCRNKFISSYFGDEAVQDCSICDNCLQQKNGEPAEKEFEKITQRIYHLIPEQGITITQLLFHLKETNREKVWKVISFLQDERRLNIDAKGIIQKL